MPRILSKITVIVSFTASTLLLYACSGAGSTVSPVPSPEPQKAERFPFPLTEPDTYSATVVLTAKDAEKKWFVARKGDKNRLDIYDGATLVLTRLLTDRLYLIDHLRKRYAIDDRSGGVNSFADDLPTHFFRGRPYRGVEPKGRNGTVAIYRIPPDDFSSDDVTIYYDESVGMVVRQDFDEPAKGISVSYQLKDVGLAVADTVFEIPAGFTQVDLASLQASLLK